MENKTYGVDNSLFLFSSCFLWSVDPTALSKGDVMFCATAITSGDLAKGIKEQGEFFEANTIALHKEGKVNIVYNNKHRK